MIDIPGFNNPKLPRAIQRFATSTTNEIEAVQNKLTLRVYDCRNKRWTDKEITMRNTAIKTLHPTARMAIGEIPVNGSGGENDPRIKMLETSFDGLKLDIASGARTHGYFLFSDSNIGGKYYGSENAMARINYGSMLMTECKLFYITRMTIQIWEETEDEGLYYRLGDSHGKVNPVTFRNLFKERPDEDPASRDVKRPFQFRMGIPERVIAKGTVAASSRVPDNIDMILPISCFKAQKPTNGQLFENVPVCFGVVHEAKLSKGKGGHQLWQWFSRDAIIDNVLYGGTELGTIGEAERLAAATDDIRSLAFALNIAEDIAADDDFSNDDTDVARDRQSGAIEEDTSESNPDQNEEGKDSFLSIVEADEYGQLTRHPNIVDKVRKRLRKRWLRLAINGANRFHSLMGMPNDTIPEDTFIAGEVGLGEHVVFRNPIRHWADIKLWQNVVQLANPDDPTDDLDIDTKGTMWIPTLTAAEIGGDFDGDKFNCLEAKLLGGIKIEINGFREKYSGSLTVDLIKPPKTEIPGTLAQVAIRAMDSKVGVVADMIARAQATGVIANSLTLKEFDYQTGQYGSGEKTITLLDFLAQELQIAVDRLKNNLFHDEQGLKKARKIIESELQPPWIGDRKNEAVYLDRPMKCRFPNGILPPDTMSYMIDQVQALWKPLMENAGLVQNYRSFFPVANPPLKWEKVSYTEEMLSEASNLNRSFAVRMAGVSRSVNSGGDDDTRNRRDKEDERKRLIQNILKDMDEFRQKIDRACAAVAEFTKSSEYQEKGGTSLRRFVFDDDLRLGVRVDEVSDELVPATIFGWVCAFWDACHKQNAGESTKGSLVFRLFPDEIIKQLGQPATLNRCEVVGCAYSELKRIIWGDPDGVPRRLEDGSLSPYGAEPDPERPHNKYLQNPSHTNNSVELIFTSAVWYDASRLGVRLRLSDSQPWRNLGILAKDTTVPPDYALNKVLTGRIYSQSINHIRGSTVTVRALVIYTI